jgi:hypothetical protein
MLLVDIEPHCKRLYAKILTNLKFMLAWFSAAILNLTKNFSSMKYAWSKYKPRTKNRMQKKNQNSLSYGRIPNFSAILKFDAILKTCEKKFLTFKFEALIFIENVAKYKNMLFEILSFLFHFLTFFGKIAPNKMASDLILLFS